MILIKHVHNICEVVDSITKALEQIETLIRHVCWDIAENLSLMLDYYKSTHFSNFFQFDEQFNSV